MSIEAMKRALSWIHYARRSNGQDEQDIERELRSAIEAAEKREPVAWRVRCTAPSREWILMYRYPQTESQFSNLEIQPLYAIPPDTARMLAEKDDLLAMAEDVINSECGFGGSNNYDPRAVVEHIHKHLGESS